MTGLESSSAASLLAEIEARGLKLAVAESLTGGELAAAITAIPGASRVFLGGVVAYQSATKSGMVGVSDATLAQFGAVSEQVAIELALGAVNSLAAANHIQAGRVIGIATTGVAGPDLQEGKAVGTVFVAVACPGIETAVRELLLTGDRAAIRAHSTQQAIDLAREQILKVRR